MSLLDPPPTLLSKENIDEEKLISQVEKHPELWDKDCEGYKKNNKKVNAWVEIAALLNANGMYTVPNRLNLYPNYEFAINEVNKKA
jgi:hypothetical protein